MTRKQARERGEMFYTGKVCERHPKLRGKRRTKSNNCPECIRERMATPHSRKLLYEARARRKEAMKAGEQVT
jgi:hypothetical protein